MGNITDKNAYHIASLALMRDAIIAKGVAVPEETTFRDYATKVGLIETGGGDGDYLVRFFDYDGTIMKEQYVNSGQNATPPTPPTHQYLTFNSWNTASTNIARDTDIGAIYDTTDGKSYLFIIVNTVTGLSPIMYLNKDTTALLTVNWGDGTSSTSSASGNINFTKTYAVAGNYTVTIECSGTYRYGNATISTPIFGVLTYQNILKKMYVGLISTYIGNYAFYANKSLSSISLGSGITNISSNSLNGCSLLQSINVYANTNISGSAPLSTCTNLRYVINSSNSVIGDNVFSGCYLMEIATLQNGGTTIYPDTYKNCYALQNIDIPATFTAIEATSFSGCLNVLEYIIRPTTPPTLGNINAFLSININCKIYVPDASVAAYKAATNWITYANYIYPLSTRP